MSDELEKLKKQRTEAQIEATEHLVKNPGSESHKRAIEKLEKIGKKVLSLEVEIERERVSDDDIPF